MSDVVSTTESLDHGRRHGHGGHGHGSDLGASVISLVAAMSGEERRSYLDAAFMRLQEAQGAIVAALGEVDRCQDFRDEGATSTEAWVVERYGVSPATARSFMGVGKVAWDLPRLVGSLCAGEISLDKVRAVAEVATPETDAQWCDQARECSVRDLVEVARTSAAVAAGAGVRPAESAGAVSEAPRSEHDRRFVRCNDAYRTITAQLPRDSYAEIKACLEARAKEVPSDGETPWDQRVCDAFTAMIRVGAGGDAASGGSTGSASPYLVVAHVPLGALVQESGQSTALAGELEHVGLIDGPTVKRIACDATIAVAVDDDVGHTMYEGRARRFPTKAQRREVLRRDRHCRFPGCTNVTFAEVHHIVAWEPGGSTDLDNLALQCLHHHHLVHSKGWTMTGNANEELTVVGPSGRVMRSRPSPLWTRISVSP